MGPGKKAARTLTLVAKTIQTLANLVEFNVKEPFMTKLNPFILEKMDSMKKFLDHLASPIDRSEEEPLTGINVDEETELLYQYLKNDLAVLTAEPSNVGAFLIKICDMLDKQHAKLDKTIEE